MFTLVHRLLAGFALIASTGVAATTVGEAHRITTTPSAALRNADHSPTIAITVWYPAQGHAKESTLTIGPPGRPLFASGRAAADAPPAPGRFPVILLSHGFGGTARMMGWFGTALARAGYMVIAVDHPGSNGRGPITPNGASWWWERADDLKAAWTTVLADPVFVGHVDMARLGVAGFSAGGFTALVAGGARVDVRHFADFCRAHPDDGVCAPQMEAPALSARDVDAWLADPAMQLRFKEAAGDHAVPGVRAVFSMAPALVQALAPASLRGMRVPVSLVVGTADTVAPSATNTDVAAALIPGATAQRLPGVSHYDFLGDCLPAATHVVPQCDTANRQDDAHTAAVKEALRLFGAVLR